MPNFLATNIRVFALLFAFSCCAGALSGCGASNAKTTNDPSQDLSRLSNGPSPEDMKAMQAAAKNNSGPPASANSADVPATP